MKECIGIMKEDAAQSKDAPPIGGLGPYDGRHGETESLQLGVQCRGADLYICCTRSVCSRAVLVFPRQGEAVCDQCVTSFLSPTHMLNATQHEEHEMRCAAD